MIWTQILYYFITLAISIALAPKPRAPKAAALEDFDFPTAQEGRPIPVVFGEVDITGANVVWYGDLQVSRIRKRSGFSKVTVGYKYFIGFHLGLCHGPVDAITQVRWDDKVAWTGNITGNSSGSISVADLFGGQNRGGGVEGDFDVLMGGDSQAANAYLAAQVGETPPAFRGITSFVWKGGWIGNSEFVKPIAIRVRRTTAGWSGGTAWYASRATIGTLMNPAHIIYQCLTDPRWGMGVDPNRLNDTAFRAAADELWDEGFGLALLWNQSTSIEGFIQVILDHIGGGLTFNLVTGQYELKLFRANYSPGDLDEFDASQIISFDRFERQLWGETVNEVSLVYTDPDSRQPTSLTAQDLGNVDAQGSRVPAIIELPGIRDHDIARSVLARELAQRTTPLTKTTFRVNRRAWSLGFGGLFRLTRPELQVFGRVFRVLRIDRGSLESGAITIEALEDIYQNDLGVGLATQPSPVAPPAIPGGDDDPETGSAVLSATTTAPPGSPADGDTYLVPAGATGDWAGETGNLAVWDADLGEWVFVAVPNGEIIFVADTAVNLQNVNGTFQPVAGGSSPLIAAGDLYTHDGASDERLPVGADGQLLSANSSEPLGLEWIDPPASSPLTTKGDVYVHDGTDVARLPVGADGLVLEADSTAPAGLRWKRPEAVDVARGARVGAISTSPQAVAGSTFTAVEFDQVAFDTLEAFDLAEPTRLTAVRSGKYLVGAAVSWETHSGTHRQRLLVRVDGTDYVAFVEDETSASRELAQNVSALVDLAAGQYVEFVVWHDVGGGLDLLRDSGNPQGWMARVGSLAVPTQIRGASWVRSSVLAVPVNSVVVHIAKASRIVGWRMSGVGVGGAFSIGSATVDVWKTDQAGFPPDVTDSICGSLPTISSARLAEDDVLSGWDVDLAAGDIVVFVLDSVSGFAGVFFQLLIQEVEA